MNALAKLSLKKGRKWNHESMDGPVPCTTLPETREKQQDECNLYQTDKMDLTY